MMIVDWDLFWLETRKNLLKYIGRYVLIAFVVFIFYQISACSPLIRRPFIAVQKPVYQMVYASGREEVPFEKLIYTIEPYDDPNPYGIITVNGMEIRKTFVRVFRGYGRVAYLDVNDALIKGWYLSSGEGQRMGISTLYKNVVPYDLFLVFGRMAEPDNFKKIEFEHEENMARLKFLDKSVYRSRSEYKNFHILPATEQIKKAISVLKYNDVVYLEGFLTDWDGTDVPRNKQWYKTARTMEEMSSFYAGGRLARLCMQLYTTKVILNGYIYQ